MIPIFLSFLIIFMGGGGKREREDKKDFSWLINRYSAGCFMCS